MPSKTRLLGLGFALTLLLFQVRSGSAQNFGSSTAGATGGTTQRTGTTGSTGGIGGAGFSPTSNFGANGGFGSGSTFGSSAAGNTGQAGTASGFVGRNDTAGRFVGNTQAGQQRAATQSQNFGGRGQAGGGGLNQTRQSTQSVRLPRPQLRVAFTHPAPKAETVASAVKVRFKSSIALRRFPGVNAEVDENLQVTLTGIVASREQVRLAALMAGFEPGVRSVRNLLEVETATGSNSGSAQP